MLNRPEGQEPLAAATAHSKPIALAGLLEKLIHLEWSVLRDSLLPLCMTAEWAKGFVRVGVSETFFGDCVICETVMALLAPAIPQASNDIMTIIERWKKIRQWEENNVCFELLNFT